MTVELPNLEERVSKAVAHYWTTLSSQGGESESRRDAVVGGKQMDEFCNLVRDVLLDNGLSDASVFTTTQRVLPGYFRATKDWDLIIVHRGFLIAAIEFKSQVGSLGNNFNNRTEEAIGNAVDLKTAYRDGAFGKERAPPFLGWVMLLEDSEKAHEPVKVKEPHFPVFPDFIADVQRPGKNGEAANRDGVSYLQRYVILLRRLVLESLYNSAAFVVSTRDGGLKGEYREPAADMTMRRLLAALAGHVSGYLAGLPEE